MPEPLLLMIVCRLPKVKLYCSNFDISSEMVVVLERYYQKKLLNASIKYKTYLQHFSCFEKFQDNRYGKFGVVSRLLIKSVSRLFSYQVYDCTKDTLHSFLLFLSLLIVIKRMKQFSLRISSQRPTTKITFITNICNDI